MGKEAWFSPPSKMETCPECCEVKVPMIDLHLLGTGNENPDPLLRSSSMVESFRVLQGSFSLTAVVRIVFPSPA